VVILVLFKYSLQMQQRHLWRHCCLSVLPCDRVYWSEKLAAK